MGKWHPFENIRTNLMNNPPLVVFFLCMVLMAAAFIGFGAYTNKHDVRDPDVTQDWNQILSSLAALKLCALDTDTEGKAASADAQHISKSLLLGHEAAGEVSANYSHWSLLVPLVLSGSTPNQHPASFKMTLRGNLLGLKGPAGKTVLNLTIHFLTERELNASHAGDGSSSGSTCLSFMAPAHVVPHTRMPPLCPASEEPYADHSVVTAMTSDQYKQGAQSAKPCYRMEFNPDPKLIMLSQGDRDLAVHHLMMVAGCLLSLCAVLCFAGSFSFSVSRKYHSTGQDLQKESLLNS
ncbi:insulin-like growth factor-binding protein 3 receptor isoform X1 [Paramormyrops kingsleyae]|uniref:Transmembrane protein 248-like n=1 Tax=Paramormyrops kingsleyae TaxID=1676925 RepID=A0A3B3TBX9_9TELE|nr:transmembrane protein 248-like [Paramormyrops kingsleyae]